MGQTPVVKTDLDQEKRAICGDIGMVCPSPFKIVRIFTSSTFTGKVTLREHLRIYETFTVDQNLRDLFA